MMESSFASISIETVELLLLIVFLYYNKDPQTLSSIGIKIFWQVMRI